MRNFVLLIEGFVLKFEFIFFVLNLHLWKKNQNNQKRLKRIEFAVNFFETKVFEIVSHFNKDENRLEENFEFQYERK